MLATSSTDGLIELIPSMALEKILHDSPFRSINKYLAHYHPDPAGLPSPPSHSPTIPLAPQFIDSHPWEMCHKQTAHALSGVFPTTSVVTLVVQQIETKQQRVQARGHIHSGGVAKETGRVCCCIGSCKTPCKLNSHQQHASQHQKPCRDKRLPSPWSICLQSLLSPILTLT